MRGGWGRIGGVVEIKTLLREYLESREAAGIEHMAVDEGARAILREWMQAARRGGVARPFVQQQKPMAAQEADTEQSVARGMETMRREMEEAPEVVVEEEMPLYFRPAGQTPEEQWVQAQKLITRWDPLRELKTLRETPVWGEGSRQADIMFVGDAPNYYDEQTQRPFCGEAGAKLDAMLKAMGLNRQTVYITHLVKYRPALPRQTFNNRPPSRDEVRVSLPVLEFEVRHVRPRVLVALGVIAARALLGQEHLPLAACQQMQNACFLGVPVVVTHHPSYLLRTTSLAERRRLWEEMLRAMEIARLPISEKQRGYFLEKSST